jgi:hypothetical protein
MAIVINVTNGSAPTPEKSAYRNVGASYQESVYRD